MAAIAWLHLSDLHFKAGTEAEHFNKKMVLEALWKDIEKQIHSGLKPDFIIFSGDVAYHGKKSEFDLAVIDFFDPLLRITGLAKDRLFVVPGNHDIDREKITPNLRDGMLTQLDDRDRVNQFLSAARDKERGLVLEKFHAYAEFIQNYFAGHLTFGETDYFYTQIIPIEGYKIAILGLNSAWMCGYGKDYKGEVSDRDHLLIGEWQLEEALERTEEADLRIAILHHPTDWLHETDRFNIEKRLEAKCDFVLHGHWHIPQVNYRYSIAGQAVYIPCGAVYANRDFPNGYNFVQIDLNSQKIRVYLRRYNDSGSKGPEWTKDIQSTGEGFDGIFELTLKNLQKRFCQLPGQVSKKILFVENEPAWQEAIRSLLIPPDFDLRIATSYAETMLLLQQSSFDLIILNLCLRHDNDYEGEAILDYLNSHNINHIPCIILTGSFISVKGLFERYNICETFVKGQSFNRAEFLRAINSYVYCQ